MWNTVIIVWIICFVDGKIINECRLVLHALTTAVFQLYLALLHLRRAMQHYVKGYWVFLRLLLIGELKDYCNDEERRMYKCTCPIKICVYFLESLCLFCEFFMHLLAVFSTLCVGLRHVLLGARFLLLSTARCLQQWLLAYFFKGELEEWQKKQKMQKDEIQKEGEQVEGFLAGSVSTLCVGLRHVLQGALFLLLSTMRWLQQWLLDYLLTGELEEWQKKQKMQIDEIQKEIERVEGFLSEYCQDAITSLKPPKRNIPDNTVPNNHIR
ncbi:uncharacterized protein [Paramisgurnus dabryanus]|uniref:uncharacterized protein n=1 Tax=Paramisgurnus dabryanus TaxID=90735 RepID=UPI0031F46C67